MSEFLKLIAYFDVITALALWLPFSCACGLLGQLAAERWISPAARWYEWGIGSALIAAIAYPFLESWTGSTVIPWFIVAIVFVEAWLLFKPRTATPENPDATGNARKANGLELGMTSYNALLSKRNLRRNLAVAAVIGLTPIAVIVTWETWKAWSHREYTIKYIVPNGFRGIIIFDEDEDHGVAPVLEEDDVYVYTVPASGKLTVKSFNLFEHYHFDAAQYENGETLRTTTPNKKAMSKGNSEKDIVLRGLGIALIGDRAQMIVSVGDYKDYRKHAYQYGSTTERPDAESNYIIPPAPWAAKPGGNE